MPYKKEISNEILELCALDVRDYESYRNCHASTAENKAKRKDILNAYTVFLHEPQYRRRHTTKRYKHVFEIAKNRTLPTYKEPPQIGHKLYRVLNDDELQSYVFDPLNLTSRQLVQLEKAREDINELPKTRGNREIDLRKRMLRTAYKSMLTDPQLQPFLLRPEFHHIPITDHKLVIELSKLELPIEDPQKEEKEAAAERARKLYLHKKRMYQHKYRSRKEHMIYGINY